MLWYPCGSKWQAAEVQTQVWCRQVDAVMLGRLDANFVAGLTREGKLLGGHLDAHRLGVLHDLLLELGRVFLLWASCCRRPGIVELALSAASLQTPVCAQNRAQEAA
jgi:hypothetical protein